MEQRGNQSAFPVSIYNNAFFNFSLRGPSEGIFVPQSGKLAVSPIESKPEDILATLIPDIYLPVDHPAVSKCDEGFPMSFGQTSVHASAQNTPAAFSVCSFAPTLDSAGILYNDNEGTTNRDTIKTDLSSENFTCDGSSPFDITFNAFGADMRSRKSGDQIPLFGNPETAEVPSAVESQPLKRERSVNMTFPVIADNMNPQGFSGIFDSQMKSKDGDGMYYCEFCDMGFKQTGNRKKHIEERHLRQKPFTCSICKASFSRKHARDTHQRAVHEKLRPFQCPFCKKMYKNRSDLNKHIRTVERKEKPFTCLTCGRSFGERGKLKRHMGIHTRLLEHNSDCL